VHRVGHSNDLWPQPLQVKHCIALVLVVASVGVVDDEALGLVVLGVGRLEDVIGCLELDLSLVLGVARVIVGGVVVIEA
jgi:hypothetical protein